MGPDQEEFESYFDALKRNVIKSRNQKFMEVHRSMPSKETPRPSILLKADVLATRSQRAKSILGNFALLREILDRHEETIHRRWQDNKKPKQRLELLRKAWGTEIASSHRPDFELFGKGDKWQQDNKTKVREAYMWPYINEEDLLKPRNLLWFMASRGRHHPSEFAATDLRAMHITLVREAATCSLPGHVMMFTGRADFECYGELLSINEHADAATWLKMGQGSPVHDGLLILEAQERIMCFLLACAQLILHDVVDPSKGPKRSAPILSQETGTGFASLVTTADRAPYLPPAQLDFDRITSLLAAGRDEAANHLWSLREDPEYFQDHALELKEHRHEIVKPREPLPSTVIDPSNSKHEYEMYSELHAQAQLLRQLSKSFAGVIRPERILPETYIHAILRFRYHLKETFLVTTQTKLSFTGSPPWRNHYHREIYDARTGAEVMAKKEPRRLNTVQTNLECILSRFATFTDRSSANQEHEDIAALGMEMFGITKIMDYLQHLVERAPEPKAMLTPYIAYALELYQPWANTFDSMLTKDRASALRSEYEERSMSVETKVIEAFIACDDNPKPGQLGYIGAPIKGRFLYPVWRSKNEETVKTMRQAESNLDIFWDAIDKQMVKKLSELGESHLQGWLKQPRELHRTPPWAEPVTIKGLSATHPLHTSIQELDLTRQLQTEQTISDEEPVAQAKAKIKTRGNSDLAELEVESQNAENIDAIIVHQPKFTLNARALRVFKVLFFTPSLNATPGEVAWTDFLYAMKSIGFAPEAMGGSKWTFHPGTVGIKHGIVFHSPHPQPKIPYRVARLHGRALTRAYGWEGHMFTSAS